MGYAKPKLGGFLPKLIPNALKANEAMPTPGINKPATLRLAPIRSPLNSELAIFNPGKTLPKPGIELLNPEVKLEKDSLMVEVTLEIDPLKLVAALERDSPNPEGSIVASLSVTEVNNPPTLKPAIPAGFPLLQLIGTGRASPRTQTPGMITA